jgi:RNA polymerase sigma-70 factor (ECF subfamily)
VQDSVWDERELVRRCKEGSEAAYAVLVRQHRQRLLNLAFRLTGSRETAEDVVQETFLAAFRGMERFEPQPALAPWLNTIAVRLAARHAARRSQLPRSIDRQGPDGTVDGEGPTAGLFLVADSATDPAAAAERAELRRELQDAIDDLPHRQRVAVVLRLVMGLEYTEAAQTMDVPLNTFKSHLLRGTQRLREALAERLERTTQSIGVSAAGSSEPASETSRSSAVRPSEGPSVTLASMSAPVSGSVAESLSMAAPAEVPVPAPAAPKLGVDLPVRPVHSTVRPLGAMTPTAGEQERIGFPDSVTGLGGGGAR